MKNKRFYWFSYPTAPKTWRNPPKVKRDPTTGAIVFHDPEYGIDFLDIHRLRDVILPDLMHILYDHQYAYSGALLNFPAQPAFRKNTLQTDETPFSVEAKDLIVACTRMPLDDGEEDRRPIDQSLTWIEKRVHNALSEPKPNGLQDDRIEELSHCSPCFPRFFDTISRTEVFLSSHAEKKLADKRYWKLKFHPYKGVIEWYQAPKRRPQPVEIGQRRAAGFLVGIPSIWEGGPRFLGAWGMGGRETFIWGQVLRREQIYGKLVEDCLESEDARLIIAEFDVPEAIPVPLPEFDIPSLRVKVKVDISLPA
jgi:hypothetical protein